jgi:hypothetical protein
MKHILKVIGVVLLVTTLASCELTRPIAATSNPIGTKMGKADATGILFFPPFIGEGDASIVTAAKNGGITKISTVDFTVTNFILFRIYTCTVTGE